MSEKQQELSLDDTFRSAYMKAGRSLLRLIRSVVQRSGKQGDEFAAECGADPGQFSQALNGHGKRFAIEWLPRVLHADRDDEILAMLASLKGKALVDVERMTPEQKLERLEKALRESGPAGEAIRRAAYGEDVP